MKEGLLNKTVLAFESELAPAVGDMAGVPLLKCKRQVISEMTRKAMRQGALEQPRIKGRFVKAKASK